MKPRYLVYILSAIILAFVVRGYFCIDMIHAYLNVLNTGVAVDDGDLFQEVCKNVEGFKDHLILSGVLALVIAICCRLKAPK
tara:strand:- start:1037 stop:1282 length:246 start_codon:yes stop_codon:yes gene_type:complete